MNVTIYVPDTGEGARIWIAACRRAKRDGISISRLIARALLEQEKREGYDERQLRLMFDGK